MAQHGVYIIILNWNGWRDTLACLASLPGLDPADYKTLVIDNASQDDSVHQIRSSRPDVELIQNEHNLGFAGGCNVGIRRALDRGAKYVWLLNNDATVDADAANALLRLAEADETVGAIGSLIYTFEEPRYVQAWGGGCVNSWLGRSRHRVAPGPLDYITGASMLLRTSALNEVGLLDERFFMYWEETDLCFRLTEAGWEIAVAEGSVVFHKESASLGKRSALKDTMFNESAVKFFMKHSRLPYIPIALGVLTRVGKRLWNGEFALALAVLKGARRGISAALG